VTERTISHGVSTRRFPPPWTFDEANDACFIVKDHNGHALAYVYFENEPGRRASANADQRRGAPHRRQHRQAAGAIAALRAFLSVHPTKAFGECQEIKLAPGLNALHLRPAARWCIGERLAVQPREWGAAS
jgi:hypothetical protein